MDALKLNRGRVWMFLAAALAIAAWGSIGFYQGLHSGFSGGLYDPQYVVPGVVPGGLAEKSGFRAGDRVISVEGVPVEELGMESRWPRSLSPGIGQSRRFVLERKGQRIPIDVVYGPPSRDAVNTRVGAVMVGLAFLGLGLWVFFRVGTSSALTLAHIGLVAGVAMSLGLGPNLGSWNGVRGHVSTALTVLTCILMLRFFVTFPRPKPVINSRWARWAVYGAWGGLLAFLVLELIFHPILYYTTGSVVFPLMLVYGILILAAITHTVVKSPRAELRESGMFLILGGVLVTIVAMVLPLTSGLNLPGWIYSLSVGAIPLAMALAVRKQARWQTGRTSED
jgi:hypothetical protein